MFSGCSNGNSNNATSTNYQPQVSNFATSTSTDNTLDLSTDYDYANNISYQAYLSSDSRKLSVLSCQINSKCNNIAATLNIQNVKNQSITVATNGVLYLAYTTSSSIYIKKFSMGAWSDLITPNLNPNNKQPHHLNLKSDANNNIYLSIGLEDQSLILAAINVTNNQITNLTSSLPNYQYGGQTAFSSCGGDYMCLAINAFNGTNTAINIFLINSQNNYSIKPISENNSVHHTFGLYPTLAYDNLNDILFLSYKNNMVANKNDINFNIYSYLHPSQSNTSWNIAYSLSHAPHGYNSLVYSHGKLLATYQNQSKPQDKLMLFQISSGGNLSKISDYDLPYHGGFNHLSATSMQNQFALSFQNRKNGNLDQILLLKY